VRSAATVDGLLVGLEDLVSTIGLAFPSKEITDDAVGDEKQLPLPQVHRRSFLHCFLDTIEHGSVFVVVDVVVVVTGAVSIGSIPDMNAQMLLSQFQVHRGCFLHFFLIRIEHGTAVAITVVLDAGFVTVGSAGSTVMSGVDIDIST